MSENGKPSSKIKAGQAVAALCAQLLSSAATFVLNFLLLQALSPTQFGLFGVLFALYLFVFGLWQGVFITQYFVLSQTKGMNVSAEVAYSIMLSVSFFATVIFTIVSAFVTNQALTLSVFSVFASAGSMLVKEFHTRRALILDKPGIAVATNTVFFLSVVSLTSAVVFLRVDIGHNTGMLLYALAIALSAVFAHFRSGLKIMIWGSDSWSTINQLMVGGKWSIVSHTFFTLRDQSHIAVVAVLLGPVALAHVNAARLFLTPPILLLPAFGNFMLPHFSRAADQGGDNDLRRMAKNSGIVLIGAVVLYSIALLLAWSYIEDLLLADSYEPLFPLVALWCIYAISVVFRTLIDIIAQAKRAFKMLAFMGGFGSGFAILAAVVLTVTLGEPGAILARSAAEIVLIILMMGVFDRKSRK